MISELKAALDIVDSILQKAKASAVERNRDRVLVAIYRLGDNGHKSVTPEQLETQGGFSKSQVLKAIEEAEEKDWIIDVSSFSGTAWLLKPKAIYHIEGLLKR
ncbi:MAG: hypothetical protein FJ023_01035 [Chloroflexi bacterium]|nr:hypothetical protein [Chloroflexota bacterium]